MIKYTGILLLLVITACGNGQTAYEYRLEGRRLGEAGKCVEAIEALEKALEINPEYDTVMLNIGMQYWRLNDLQKAEQYFKKTIEVNVKYDKAYINLGRILSSPDSKLENFDKGIQFARNDSVRGFCYKLKGDVYIRQKRYRIALENYTKSRSLFPEKIELLRMCGTLHSKLAEFSKANKLHQKAIDLAPNDAESYNDYGASLQRQNRMKDAITMHQQACVLAPENFKFRYNLATACFTNADYQMALEEIEKCLVLDTQNTRALLLKGKILLKKDDQEEACTIFELLCSLASKEGVDLSELKNADSISVQHDDLSKNMKSISEYIEAMEAGIHPVEIVFYEAFLFKKHCCSN